MSRTISDWIIQMKKSPGLHQLGRDFHTNKIVDSDRLIQSGLPTLDHLKMPYNDFVRCTPELEAFLARHKAYVVRAIPNTDAIHRQYNVGVYSYEDCLDFLNMAIEEGDEDKHKVYLTEYEPESWAGIIISRPRDVLIEVAKVSLAELSHDQVNSVGGRYASHTGSIKTMRYTTDDPEAISLMWAALQYLRKRDLPDSPFFPELDLVPGYFEFVVTKETNRIMFLDYKVNDTYLR
ncbi:MAG: hypothetical protein ABIE94_01415 [archaeon]